MPRITHAHIAPRFAAALGAALVALLAYASTALATTVQLVEGVAPDPDRLVVNGSMGDNEITVRYDRLAGRYVVADASEPVEGMGCTWVSRHAEVCETTPDAELEITGQEGRDSIEIAKGKPKLGARIDGGKGRDVIRGGDGPDEITKSGGHDKIRGRGGPDRLTDFGGDWYYGGRGRDILYALNDDRDRRIDCGVGQDEAVVDDKDPKPRNCERVE